MILCIINMTIDNMEIIMIFGIMFIFMIFYINYNYTIHSIDTYDDNDYDNDHINDNVEYYYENDKLYYHFYNF